MRILLALDGSPASIQARDLVAALPWPGDTVVTLLQAVQVPPMWYGDTAAAAGGLAEAEEALQQQALEALAVAGDVLEQRGLAVECRVVRDRAASGILAVADELDADLIALGSRGQGPVASMVLGSVSAEVAGSAKHSVLVARGERVSRILVATDGSPGSSVIPEVLGTWGVLRGLPTVALSVAPVDSPAYRLMVTLYTLGSESSERQSEELLAQHREYAARMAERLAALGIPAEAQVGSGDAAQQIIAAAAADGADLVVTGSRWLRDLDQWLFGSVARNVLYHCPASVLIVRARGTAPARNANGSAQSK